MLMTLPMDIVDWDRLRIFRVVVDAGSFTAAAKELALSQSAVSRQVCSLESSLHTPLFYRHARGLRLTEHGEALHQATRHIELQIANALETIANTRATPEGPLRITTTVGFGSAWLSPRMARFHQLYPEIQVSMLLQDGEELDLLSREADVAIRFEPQRQGSLIEQRILSIRFHVYASASYLESAGIPRCTADLDSHQLIVYGQRVARPSEASDWLLHLGRDHLPARPCALRVNDLNAMYRAVRSGLGIAVLPDYIVGDDRQVQAIDLENMTESLTLEAFLVFAEDKRGSKRIEALRNFLLGEALLEKKPTQARLGGTS